MKLTIKKELLLDALNKVSKDSNLNIFFKNINNNLICIK